ncbi:uncharacterized protein LOC128554703, partial [Mercenaria mercenaria]|uniref:uncharacterized protein LOC128554703 n=1 Tax=Mercenaria mercenaria TaxID=6596 RepID=UPI00234E41D7
HIRSELFNIARNKQYPRGSIRQTDTSRISRTVVSKEITNAKKLDHSEEDTEELFLDILREIESGQDCKMHFSKCLHTEVKQTAAISEMNGDGRPKMDVYMSSEGQKEIQTQAGKEHVLHQIDRTVGNDTLAMVDENTRERCISEETDSETGVQMNCSKAFTDSEIRCVSSDVHNEMRKMTEEEGIFHRTEQDTYDDLISLVTNGMCVEIAEKEMYEVYHKLQCSWKLQNEILINVMQTEIRSVASDVVNEMRDIAEFLDRTQQVIHAETFTLVTHKMCAAIAEEEMYEIQYKLQCSGQLQNIILENVTQNEIR